MNLCANDISAALPEGSLFAGKIRVKDCVDSTNTQLKALAAGGAPEGTVLLAEEQAGGRGTRGRTFCSPRGEGLYLSVLLRPRAELEDLLQLTGWVAVAARRAVERACSAPVGIKWLNDLYLNGKKLCGILTELSLDSGGRPDYVVVGVGVNVSQSRDTFRAQGLGEIATSLAAEGYSISRISLCAALLEELDRMYRRFPADRRSYLEEYRKYCLTPGKRVSFEERGQTLSGMALAVDNSFGLTVRGTDGKTRTVFSGTVSHV